MQPSSMRRLPILKFLEYCLLIKCLRHFLTGLETLGGVSGFPVRFIRGRDDAAARCGHAVMGATDKLRGLEDGPVETIH